MHTPHIIETTVLLLLVFLIGCAIGYVLRMWLNPSAIAASGQGSGSAPQPEPETPAVADTAPATPEAPVTVPQPPAQTEEKAEAPAEPEAEEPVAPKVAAAPEKATAPEETAAPSDGDRPEGLDAPRGGVKDDLKRIKGIGPKIEGTLNGLGVYHFDQIAAWDRKAVAWVDDTLSFKGRIDREDWIAQAKSLAKK